MAIHLYDGILPVNSQQEGVLVTMEVIFSWRRQLNNQIYTWEQQEVHSMMKENEDDRGWKLKNYEQVRIAIYELFRADGQGRPPE